MSFSLVAAVFFNSGRLTPPTNISWTLLQEVPPPKVSYDWTRTNVTRRKPTISMLFVGGTRHSITHTSWIARMCTNKCARPPMASRLVVGSGRGDLDSPAPWNDVRIVEVSPQGEGHTLFGSVGPEDPRLDEAMGSQFALVNLPWGGADAAGCRTNGYWGLVRHQVFVPLDPMGRSACFIDVIGHLASPCTPQKNWVTLVPRNSSNIFIIYSLEPFQVLKFSQDSCTARAVWTRSASASHTQVQPAIVSHIAGGTRFVFGFAAKQGDVYWAVAHGSRVNSRWRYASVLVAVLATHRDAAFSFQLIGRSCPFELGGLKERWRASFAYVHSIFYYNTDRDVATLGLHLNDRVNLVINVRGVTPWVASAYHRHTKDGTPLHCRSF